MDFQLSPRTVMLGLWAAGLLGGAGVLAGLAAAGRGARVPLRPLTALAVAAVAVLTVLPPTGSTDSLDYAAYGRIVVLGHNSYLMTTTDQLGARGDPAGRVAPLDWGHAVSRYGPLATAEKAGAAWLGGTSPARIVF